MKTKLLICAVFILLFASCKQAEAADVASVNMAVVAVDSTAVAAEDYDAYSGGSNYDSEAKDMKLAAPPPRIDEMETKIIKSGNLKFQSDDLEATYTQIQTAVKKYNALIKNDSQTNNDYALSRTVNIRIPNQHFDAFIADISKGVKYFDQKEVSSQDVTEEYIDVASRIKTKKVLEARYLELLKKANKVSEMLEIESQLSDIREEIEAKEGRLRYLQNKVSMSTLDIEFYKPVATGGKATVSYGGRIWNAIASGFNGISNFFIGIIENWPIIITLVVLILLIRKRFKRKNQ